MGRHALLQGGLPDSVIKPASPAAPTLQAPSLSLSPRASPSWSAVTLIKTLKPGDGRAGRHLPVLSQRLL